MCLILETKKMRDLELAKLRLKEGDLTLVVVKEGKVIFETNSPGVSGFLQVIEKYSERLASASAGDTIVGKAAAILCAYSKMASMYAVTISEEGMRVLEDYNIVYQFENQVPNILNHDKTDTCPFEKLVKGSRNPEEAFMRLKSFYRSLQPRNP